MIRALTSALLIATAGSLCRVSAQVSDPWNTPATTGQEASFAARFPRNSIIAVPEVREHPIRLFDALPTAWAGRSAESLSAFNAEARPGEYFVFQLAVYAAPHRLENVRVASGGLGGADGQHVDRAAVTCFNT